MALIIRSESNIAESRLHGSSNPIKVLGTLHCSSHLFPTKLESNTSKIPSEGSLTSGRGSQGLKLSSHTVFVAVRDRILSRKHRQEHGDTLIGKNSLHVSSNSVTILGNFISQVLFLPHTELEPDNSEGRRLLWRLSKNNFHQTSPLKMWCVREHFHVTLPRRAW